MAVNGQILENISGLGVGETRRLRLPIAGRAGANDVLIAYSH